MKADSTEVGTFTTGTNSYEIPLFQRNYEWGLSNWARLWEDILEIYKVEQRRRANSDFDGKNLIEKKHFIGSTLIRPLETLGGGLGYRWLVIDGQQRLITLFILNAALRDHMMEFSESVPNDDSLSIITSNKAFGGKQIERFTVSKTDNRNFQELIRGLHKNKLSDEVAKSNLGKAYLYFRWQLWSGDAVNFNVEDYKNEPPKPSRKRNAPNIGDFYQYWPRKETRNIFDLPLLANCINYGLYVLEIRLDSEDDEPDAVIFETINALGTPLAKFELIKNSFFLRLGDLQEEYFNETWNSFEQSLVKYSKKKSSASATNRFKDDYIWNYLVSLGVDKVSNIKLYERWLQYVRNNLGALGEGNDGDFFKEAIADPFVNSLGLFLSSTGLSQVLRSGSETKQISNSSFNLILDNSKLSSTITPIHMMLLRRWMENKMSDEDLNRSLKMIQTAVLRIILSGEKLNNMRSSIISSAPKLLRTLETNLENFGKALFDGLKVPQDSQLRNSITSSSCATNDNSFSMLIILRGIERHIRGASAHPFFIGSTNTNWQIEHIYPQSDKGPGPQWLSDVSKWKLSTEMYEPLKHTLGNITVLIGEDNNSISQKSFSSKKELYEKNGLAINREIISSAKWTPKEISGRSSILLSFFLDEWPI